jgi:SAM-dependent methyltransferase
MMYRLSRGKNAWNDSAAAYTRHLKRCLRQHRGDRDLAFADATGSTSIQSFHAQGDGQVAVLRHHGLRDGMSVYDLGCGCGRTAQALQRSGWKGQYVGTDIVKDFVAELERKCPGYRAHVHRQPTIIADDSSLDFIYHWSVFTHICPEDAFLYLEDSLRALKPGGKLVFSFLELENDEHRASVFDRRVALRRRGKALAILDTFLHRDWIRLWADKFGFEQLEFTEGADCSIHPATWQTIAVMARPFSLKI